MIQIAYIWFTLLRQRQLAEPGDEQASFFERQARVLAAAARTAGTSHDANAFRKLATYFEAQSLRDARGRG